MWNIMHYVRLQLKYLIQVRAEFGNSACWVHSSEDLQTNQGPCDESEGKVQRTPLQTIRPRWSKIPVKMMGDLFHHSRSILNIVFCIIFIIEPMFDLRGLDCSFIEQRTGQSRDLTNFHPDREWLPPEHFVPPLNNRILFGPNLGLKVKSYESERIDQLCPCGAQWLIGRMPDSQSKDPGFEWPLQPFQSLGIFILSIDAPVDSAV